MSLPRLVKGARHSALQITWKRENGDAVDLTGATVTGTLQNAAGTATAIAGTLALTTPSSGIFTWTLAAADIATAGRFTAQFKATYADTTYELSFPEVLMIEPSLA